MHFATKGYAKPDAETTFDAVKKGWETRTKK